jgi:hypothetical protein
VLACYTRSKRHSTGPHRSLLACPAAKPRSSSFSFGSLCGELRIAMWRDQRAPSNTAPPGKRRSAQRASPWADCKHGFGAQLSERQAFSKEAKQMPPAVMLQPGVAVAGTSTGAAVDAGSAAAVVGRAGEVGAFAREAPECSALVHAPSAMSTALDAITQTLHRVLLAIAENAFNKCTSVAAVTASASARQSARGVHADRACISI